jgi:hypothetical protein
LYWLLAQTGLRIGEALALTWDTVDAQIGMILVRDTVLEGKIQKNETSRRPAAAAYPSVPNSRHILLSSERTGHRTHTIWFSRTARATLGMTTPCWNSICTRYSLLGHSQSRFPRLPPCVCYPARPDASTHESPPDAHGPFQSEHHVGPLHAPNRRRRPGSSQLV